MYTDCFTWGPQFKSNKHLQLWHKVKNVTKSTPFYELLILKTNATNSVIQ